MTVPRSQAPDSSTFSFTVENVENYDVSDVYVFYNFFDEDGNILTLYQFEEILADCESISIECLVSSGTTATFNFQTKQN